MLLMPIIILLHLSESCSKDIHVKYTVCLSVYSTEKKSSQLKVTLNKEKKNVVDDYYDWCLCVYSTESNPSTKTHVIKEKKNWIDAQKYCRDHHTDLVSGFNQIDHVVIDEDRDYWTGLFRDTWWWSDGSSSSFRHWNHMPSSEHECAVTMLKEGGRWKNAMCNEQKPFFCYDGEFLKIHEDKVTSPHLAPALETDWRSTWIYYSTILIYLCVT